MGVAPSKRCDFCCALGFASNLLIPPKFRATSQCHPAHHRHQRRISNFMGVAPSKRCEFAKHLDLHQLCSYHPNSERHPSATQPTISTSAGSAISWEFLPAHVVILAEHPDLQQICSYRPNSERHPSATHPTTSASAGSAISWELHPANAAIFADHPDLHQICSYRPNSE